MVVSGNKLTLAATNDRVTAVGSISVVEPVEFEGLVNYGQFFYWLNNVVNAGENVTFSLSKGRLNVRMDKNRKASFAVADAFVFPKVFELPPAPLVTIGRKTFGAMVKSVATLATGETHMEPMRYVMVELGAESISMIATDGIRFGYHKGGLQRGQERLTLYVNAAAFVSMDSAIGGENVNLSFADGKVFLNSANVYAYSISPREIKYPDAKLFLSQNPKHKARVPRDSFMSSLQAAGAFASGKDLLTKQAVIRILNDGVSVEADRGEMGGSDIFIPLGTEAIVEPGARMKVNVEHLLDICQRIDNLYIWIHFERQPNGAPLPIHITGTDDSQRFILAAVNDAPEYKLELVQETIGKKK